MAAASELQTETLVASDSPRIASVQLMNRHQTKGREADAVVLVLREDGWVTSYRDSEPFEDASRLLYVTLTRAKTRVTVVLPPDPHPLVAPFAEFV
jgi:DNA helicase II / ATP-dependent DNA helicase PcrA